MLVDDFLANSASHMPDKIACVCEGKRVSYGALEAKVNQLAHALIDAGVERGDRVAVYLENSVEAVVSVFGILRAGAAFVVMNPTTKNDKLAYMLNDCAARAIVLDGSKTSAIETIDEHVDSVTTVIACGPQAQGGRTVKLNYHADLARYPLVPPPRQCIDFDLAAIIYTSGSTGRPKGVTVTHLNMVSAATSITTYLENVEDDIILNVLPMSFDYGLYQVLMTVKLGARVILEKSFAFPYKVIKLMQEEQVTGFPGVPTIFAMLLQLKDIDPSMFDEVRFVTNTAAALPPAHILRLRDLFRRARIYSMYGITECKRVSYLPPEQLDIRPGSVGRGMPNQETYIVDDDGNLVGPGVVGELVVRGANVMQGYWGKPEETSRVLRPGRYPWERVLYTGDLFKMDEEGYLYFVSRKDDIIKSRGEKVSPKEVESVIYELPDVKEVAVVGMPDPILGEAVRAVIVKSEGSALSEKEILRHCTKRLENFMVPKVIEFQESLPKTTTGKISRTMLKMGSEESAKGATG